MPNDSYNANSNPGILLAANDAGNNGNINRVVRVASFTELSRPSHVQRLAVATEALNYSRRKFLDELADAIFAMEGRIFHPNGSVFPVPATLIDDTFADADARWLSDFKRFAVDPPRQKPQNKVMPRLQLIDLYFRIRYPERAKLIAK